LMGGACLPLWGIL